MRAILLNRLTCRKTVLLFSAILFSFVAFAQPANDNCASAITLTSNISCNNIGYTITNATASGGVPAGCSAGTHYDVWFKFTAVSATQTATISNM